MDHAPDTGWMLLTPGQLDFWEEFLAHPGQPVSTVAHLTRIEGDVDDRALAQAIRMVAAETDVMALRFATRPDGTPMQRVNAAARSAPRLLDLRGDPDPKGRARALMEDDLARPLDPADFRRGIRRCPALAVLREPARRNKARACQAREMKGRLI